VLAYCVFQAAAPVMIWFPAAKRLVISVRHSGALSDDDGAEVLSDAAERKQEPLDLRFRKNTARELRGWLERSIPRPTRRSSPTEPAHR
jgi:hypothetical protein